ncbi:MAG: response regulator transcription factor [Chloroflexi bacterium]|nr:response regulator transcription factor [Chloroflexota bacterium]
MADFPRSLEAVILKSLEKQPARRYQSAAQLAAALDAALFGMTHQSAPSPAARPAASTSTGESARTLRVMLADDHTLLRQSLAGMLESSGNFVIVAEAGDGETALNKAMAVLPDLLLLDINMPGRSGLEILPLLRRDAPQVKVLILTGREEDAYIIRALRAGANGYLLKSSDESELLDGINRVMQGQLSAGPWRGRAGRHRYPRRGGGALDELETRVIQHVAAGFRKRADRRRARNPPSPR